MNIVFGWHLDGPTCPETPGGEAFAVDAAVVGPLQLLDVLETRLGLNGPRAAPAIRIAQYLARLRAVDDGSQFFSRSLGADGWATARLLLGWRDELAAAGWTPDATSWNSARLATLARAETKRDHPLAAAPAERVRSIVARIPEACPVEKLTLVDDLEQLPPVWRRLVETLRQSGASVCSPALEPAATGSDLARVQALLHSGQRTRLTGDDSFTVVQCDNELVAADIAAEWLAAATDDNRGVAVVRQGDGTILDAACRRLGLARPGGSWRSPFRGALQSLPLAFETAWQPLDAARLLELLVMPGSPVPRRAGRHFADVLRQSPGTGGAAWRAAWQLAEERLREDLEHRDLDESEVEKAIRKSLADWHDWLEPERFHRSAGIPAGNADAICRKVQRWAQRRASTTEDAIYLQTSTAAASLANIIAASGIDPIPKPQLDRMIDAVIADGIARPGTIAEAAPWTTVDAPEQIWGEVPSVLWWGFADGGATAPRTPWTDAEQAELTAAGANLLSPGALITRNLDAQRRAFLGASRRMLLVHSDLTAAEATAPHALWHEIAGLDGLSKALVKGRSLRQVSRASLCGRAWQPVKVDSRELPNPVRDWSVAENLIGARATESATSLESLLGCPLKWVLQYHSRLRASSLLDMAEGNRLKGNVAHEVLARLLRAPLPDDEAGIRRDVADLLDAMLPEIGSPLLLPGQSRHREELCRNTIESAVVLAGILRDAGFSVVATERPLTCALDDRVELVGKIDLELATALGDPVVFDLKWSNRAKYRQAEVEEARAVQLATYARLLKGESNAFPPGAYFMIKQRRLLAVDAQPLPEEFRIGGSDLPEVWRAIVEVRKQALGELEAGRIVATGVEPDDVETDAREEKPISVGPPCAFCDYGHLCGVSTLS